MKILNFFLNFCGSFLPSWIRIWQNSNECGSTKPCLDGLYLLADGGEGSLLESVELVEAAPGAHLAQAHKDPAHRLEIKGLVAVEDQDKPDNQAHMLKVFQLQ